MRGRTLVMMGIVALLMTGTLMAQAPETFQGRLVDTGGAIPRGTSTYITIHVDKYTPDSEVQRLAKILATKGQDALIQAMWDEKSVGYVKIGSALGYQVAVIRSLPGKDGGRIIRVVTDRPIQFVEVMRSLRSRDYPFGLIELELGPDGRGKGVMVAAAKMEFDENGRLNITSYGTQPFKILGVRVEKDTKKD